MKNVRVFFALSSALIVAASVFGVSADARKSDLDQCNARGLNKAECACEMALQKGSKKALRDFLKLYRNADTACNALASTAIITNNNSNSGEIGSSSGSSGSSSGSSGGSSGSSGGSSGSSGGSSGSSGGSSGSSGGSSGSSGGSGGANNGHGNGDQEAPGNSGDHNNAENSEHSGQGNSGNNGGNGNNH